MDGYLTRKQVAEKLQLHEQTIASYEKKGMPFYRLGTKIHRYKLEEVTKWFEQYNKTTL